MSPRGWQERVLSGARRPSALLRLLSRHEDLALALASGVLLLLTWWLHRVGTVDAPLAVAGFLAVGLICGRAPILHLVGGLRQGRLLLDIDFLMMIAAIGAAVVGAWAEGAFLLFLFALANALEGYALERARSAIGDLAKLAPDIARVVVEGRDLVVPIESVRAGDLVSVHPGERIPVDGTLTSGSSAVDQASITGESVPVEKQVGDDLYAGTVNGDGAIEIEVTRAVGDRTLDRVIRLVEEAREAKAPTERITARFEKVFVPLIVVADALLIVIPPLLGLSSWSDSLYRGMTVLVAASPCALALGPPAAMLAGIAQAARRGVLIKGGAHLEALAQVQVVTFDKTGTLTMGRPEVVEVAPATGVSPEELLTVAAAVERRSQHPLARAVVRRAEGDGLELPTAGDLQSVTARGVRSDLAGVPVRIGSLKLWGRSGDSPPDDVVSAVDRMGVAGRSVMVVQYGERWLGALGLTDPVRPSVRPTFDSLRAMGLGPLVMLTGDHKGVADAVGREVGIDEVYSDLLPEEKVTIVKELTARAGPVVMVGDGVNDAPALAAALVGVAMGGAGSATALETADAALMGDDLARLPFAIGLARRAKRLLRQNLAIAGGTMVVLLLLAAGGVLPIGAAVIGHEGSTLIVIGNALRLLSYENS